MLIDHIIFVCVCANVCVLVHVCYSVSVEVRGQPCGSQFSPILWIPGIELNLLVLAVSTFMLSHLSSPLLAS